MTLKKLATLLFLAAPFVAACGDFWQNPNGSSTSSTTSTTSTSTTASSGDFYILNNGTTPEILGESIVSGTLTALSGSPWTLTQIGTPYAMAMAPSGNFLAVSTITGVYTYPISGGGLGNPNQVSTDTTALAIQVDTSGSWLIEALQTTGEASLAAIPINSSTGAQNGTEVAADYTDTSASVQQGQIAISKDDKNIFVALGTGGAIVVPFNVSATSGTSPFGASAKVIPVSNSSIGSTLSVAVDPDDRLFYVGETNVNSTTKPGGLFAFNYSSLTSSTLTQAAGSPLASDGLAPNFILPDSSGGYVYVGNGQGTGSAGNITGFSVTASGSIYTIAADTTVSAGAQPIGLAEDDTGAFVLGVNQLGSPYFDAYTFDATTAGKLDSQITADTGATPLAIVAAPQ
jgi:hypothetical protein